MRLLPSVSRTLTEVDNTDIVEAHVRVVDKHGSITSKEKVLAEHLLACGIGRHPFKVTE